MAESLAESRAAAATVAAEGGIDAPAAYTGRSLLAGKFFSFFSDTIVAVAISLLVLFLAVGFLMIYQKWIAAKPWNKVGTNSKWWFLISAVLFTIVAFLMAIPVGSMFMEYAFFQSATNPAAYKISFAGCFFVMAAVSGIFLAGLYLLWKALLFLMQPVNGSVPNLTELGTYISVQFLIIAAVAVGMGLLMAGVFYAVSNYNDGKAAMIRRNQNKILVDSMVKGGSLNAGVVERSVMKE